MFSSSDEFFPSWKILNYFNRKNINPDKLFTDNVCIQLETATVSENIQVKRKLSDYFKEQLIVFFLIN